MPSAKMPRRVSRKATTLKELRESAFKTTSGKKLRYKWHLNEIVTMCREIRSKNVVSPSFSSAELVSTDGVTLDHDLTKIKCNTVENYSNYKEKYFNTMSFGCDIKVPIFIIDEEREDYSKTDTNGFRKDCRKKGLFKTF